MRQRQVKTRDAGRETSFGSPMAEGVRPLEKRQIQNWRKLSDDEILAFAKRYAMENGISTVSSLSNKAHGLYNSLKKRGLLEAIIPKVLLRNWSSVSDDEIVRIAKDYMKDKGITGKKDLAIDDVGLYKIIMKRKLSGRIGFQLKRSRECRSWLTMSDGEIVDYALKFLKENEISSRNKLYETDVGLYEAVRKRGLFDRIGLKTKDETWHSMSDDELVHYVKSVLQEKGITRMQELESFDRTLCRALQRKGLMDGFGIKKRKLRKWSSMTDDQLVEHAKSFIMENRITRMADLEKADNGLHAVLTRRALLGKIGFEQTQRDWSSLTDEEIEKYAQSYVRDKGITTQSELKNADQGLLAIVQRRKLLYKIGLRQRSNHKQWRSMTDDQLIEKTLSYMKENGIKARTRLQKTEPWLFTTLEKRGLLDRIGFVQTKKGRPWSKMDDDQIVQYAESFMKENGITGRNQLIEEDPGLHEALRKRTP